MLETRFSSIALSREWSRYREQRVKEIKRRRKVREDRRKEEEENFKVRDEIYKSIDSFERNQGTRPIDSDED